MRVNSELLGAQLENLGSDVTPASTDKGRIYHKSASEPLKVSDGTTVHKVLTDQMYASIADGVETLVQIGHAQVTSANYGLAASNSGSFTTASTSYVDITNQSVSITTTGKPVEITIVGGSVGCLALGTISKEAHVKALRDATSLDELEIDDASTESGSVVVPGGAFKWVDTPAAGTYTYKLQMKVTNASATGSATNIKIFVKEL